MFSEISGKTDGRTEKIPGNPEKKKKIPQKTLVKKIKPGYSLTAEKNY